MRQAAATCNVESDLAGSAHEALVGAVKGGDAAAVVAVLDSGAADVNAAGAQGWTPLHYAATSGRRLGALKALLARGADANAAAVDGKTPLMFAASVGSVACLWALLEHGGAEVNARAKGSGWTALHHAVLWRQYECVKALLDAGADLDDGPAGVARQSNGGAPMLQLLESYPAEQSARADATLRAVGGTGALPDRDAAALVLSYLGAARRRAGSIGPRPPKAETDR